MHAPSDTESSDKEFGLTSSLLCMCVIFRAVATVSVASFVGTTPQATWMTDDNHGALMLAPSWLLHARVSRLGRQTALEIPPWHVSSVGAARLIWLICFGGRQPKLLFTIFYLHFWHRSLYSLYGLLFFNYLFLVFYLFPDYFISKIYGGGLSKPPHSAPILAYFLSPFS